RLSDGDRVHDYSAWINHETHETHEMRSLRFLFVCFVVYFFFCIFAQVSRSVTTRLKTGFPGAESLSTQKYPSRSNWNLSPTAAFFKPGSSLAPFNTTSDSGFRFARYVCPSGTSSTSGFVNRWS